MEAPPSYEAAEGQHGSGFDSGRRSRDGFNHDETVQGLLDRRPSFELFTIEDPLDDNAAQGTGWAPQGRASQVASHLKNKIFIPVRHFVVDPVYKAWVSLSGRFDAAIDPFINPLLARRILVLVITGAFLLLFYYMRSDNPFGANGFTDLDASRENLRKWMTTSDLSHFSEYLDSMPHYAGTSADYTTDKYVHDLLSSYGLSPVSLDQVITFLTHPKEARIYQLNQDGSVASEIEVLEDPPSPEDKSPQHARPRPHMSLGLGGDVTGKLLYVNYGSMADVNFLQSKGISLDGAIAIVRYGKGAIATNLKRLKQAGVAGALVFNEKHPTEASWPDGPDYAESSIRRGSLGLPQAFPGDILTPGVPSSARMRFEDLKHVKNLVKIPVTPISWKQAGVYLSSLKSHGVRVDEWHNNGYPREVEEWWTGDGSDESPRVRLKVETITEERHLIHNVLTRIPGREQNDKAIIIGASLDTQCGAGVGTSGLTVLLQVAKAFAYMHFEQHWKPLRPIYFMAWDGTHQNFAGATEWVESYDGQLRDDGVIYIDLDGGVSGDKLSINGHPAIFLEDALSAVSFKDKTLRELFMSQGGDLQKRDIDGDFGNKDVFSSHVGIPTISLSFEGAVYPKDSCTDTLEWQKRFGDSDFSAHLALAQLAAFVALEHADRPVIKMQVSQFGHELHRYLQATEEYGKRNIDNWDREWFKLPDLTKAIDGVVDAGVRIDNWSSQWDSILMPPGNKQEAPMARGFRFKLNDHVNRINKQMMNVYGLFRRTWFRHVVFGESYDRDIDDPLSGTFPGIRDSIHWQDPIFIRKAVEDAARVIENAGSDILGA